MNYISTINSPFPIIKDLGFCLKLILVPFITYLYFELEEINELGPFDLEGCFALFFCDKLVKTSFFLKN